jgi:hypothetical protein
MPTTPASPFDIQGVVHDARDRADLSPSVIELIRSLEEVEELDEDALDALSRTPSLKPLVLEWKSSPVFSLLPFGTYLSSRLEDDWQYAHHWGFLQGVQAQQAWQRQRKQIIQKPVNQPEKPPYLWLAGSSLGLILTIPFLLDPTLLFVWRWLAALLAMPFLLVYVAASILIVLHHWDRAPKAVEPEEPDEAFEPVAYTAGRARFLDEREEAAADEFVKEIRKNRGD